MKILRLCYGVRSCCYNFREFVQFNTALYFFNILLEILLFGGLYFLVTKHKLNDFAGFEVKSQNVLVFVSLATIPFSLISNAWCYFA